MRVLGGLPDLLEQLGGKAVDAKQLERLGDKASLERLNRLAQGYSIAATPASNKFDRTVNDERVELPEFGFHPSAKAMYPVLKPYVEPGYFNAPSASEHVSANKSALISNLMNPRRTQAARLTYRIQNDELTRAAFEKKAGLLVVRDGRTDGRISVDQSGMSGNKAGGVNVGAMNQMPTMPSQENVFALFNQMDQDIMAEAYKLGLGTTSGPTSLSGMNLFGTVLGAGSALGITSSTASSGDNSTFNDSVDVATLNLKRMIDKRDQCMNAYRSVFDKYGESAKQMIDALRA